MTNDELLQMARELNGRGEAYALVTVVRALAPTSAYLGAQARANPYAAGRPASRGSRG